LALGLVGCATVTRGTTDQLQILSEPSEARATTSIGHSCQTPCTITISRKDEFTVTVEKPGYEPAQVPVITEWTGTGGTAFAANILLGGVVGMGADLATGAAYNHVPNPVSVMLAPLRPAVESAPPARRPVRVKRRAPTS